MQVSVETTTGLERRLTVGVPAERIETEVDKRLKKAAQTVQLKGFRPGKVPLKVVRQRFGAGVRQEVLGEVVNQTFYEAIQQQDLKPAGQPSIEPKSIEPGRDVEYVATFEVYPEVEPKDYSTLEVTKPVASITDADIDKVIESLRMQAATWETVERAAEKGDTVNIDYTGTRDGEAFEGGSAEGQELQLGSGRMIPGFEDAVEGMQPGEEKTVPLTFPEDYHAEELKGAAVEFKIKLNSVQERRPAELDEELFKRYGVEEGGVDEFRKQVAENMERELKSATRNKVKTQVMDGLLELHQDLTVPKALVTQEVDVLRNQAMQQFGGLSEQMDPRQLLPDELFAEQAERRVKLGLILNELIARNEIKPQPEEVRAAVEDIASTYEDQEQVVNWYYSNQEQLQGVEAMVLEDKVVDSLLDSAKTSEKAASYEEVMAPEPQPEAEGEEQSEDQASDAKE